MNQIYNKQNPFLASIKERYSLCKAGSKKNTQHIVLNLQGSGLSYEVGDSIGIFAKHSLHLVQQTLNAMHAAGDEEIHLKSSDKVVSLREFLTSQANITTLSPKLLKEVCQRQIHPEKKAFLDSLLDDQHREHRKEYVARHEVWDFLLAHSEVRFAPQELADLLMPLLPRFYSISSSQNYVGEEVHLTVAPLEYDSNGYPRYGVCTYYLCQLVPLHAPVVPIFIQPSHHFRLPQDPHRDLIMIGPGTGVAPFRAFLQERLFYQSSKGRHWLFFGEWNRQYHFFYEDEWKAFSERGHLRLETAFSRDQEHKLYVQHKMKEHGGELYRWLEEGAYLYVCGDAQFMAKDVEAILQDIVREHAGCDEARAREYIKHLRQQKRYLRDVY